MSGSLLQRGPYLGPWSTELNSRMSLSSDSGILSPTSSGYSTPDALRSGQNSPGSEVVSRTASTSLAALTPLAFGPQGGLSERVVLLAQSGQKLLSPWQDVPLLWPEGFLSCVCTTPEGSWLRHEIALDEPFHPLRPVRTGSMYKEDWIRRHDGVVPQNKTVGQKGWDRVKAHVMTSSRPAHYSDNTPWSIGALPQTWGCTGELGSANSTSPDGVLRVFDIASTKARQPGEVYLIKPLGAFAVVEEGGELAWMIVGIAADDQVAGLLRDANDILAVLPGLLEVLCEYMETCLGSRIYGSEKRRMVRGPYLLNVAMAKIRDYHKAWHLTREHVQQHVNLPQIALTPAIMEKVWSPFTAQDRKSLLGPVPVSNPDALTIVDNSWLEGEDEELEVELLPVDASAEAVPSSQVPSEASPTPKAAQQATEPSPSPAAPAPAPASPLPEAPSQASPRGQASVSKGPASPSAPPATSSSTRASADKASPELAMYRYSSGAGASKPPPYAGYPSTTKQKRGFSKWWSQFRGKAVTRAPPVPVNSLN